MATEARVTIAGSRYATYEMLDYALRRGKQAHLINFDRRPQP